MTEEGYGESLGDGGEAVAETVLQAKTRSLIPVGAARWRAQSSA